MDSGSPYSLRTNNTVVWKQLWSWFRMINIAGNEKSRCMLIRAGVPFRATVVFYLSNRSREHHRKAPVSVPSVCGRQAAAHVLSAGFNPWIRSTWQWSIARWRRKTVGGSKHFEWCFCRSWELLSDIQIKIGEQNHSFHKKCEGYWCHIDSVSSMEHHINVVCRACHYPLKNSSLMRS